MSIKKLSFMLLSAISLTALLNGCGSSSKEGSPGGVARVADEGVCIVCHSTTIDHTSGTNIVTDYSTAAHKVDAVGCEGCHGGGSQHNGVGPFPYPNPLTADRCITCHTANGLADTSEDLTPLFARAKDTTGATGVGFTDNKCAHCHTASGVGSVHGAQVPTTQDCIQCHDVPTPQHGSGRVGDNNGVRAITTEFAKWSHHVTGVTLNAAHCTACHLEGTVVNGQVVIDETKHMADNKIHLRNADDDSDFGWNPAAPVQADFTGMDNFCMSCHDSDGATSPVSRKVQTYINFNGIAAAGKVASPTNPFGDTISNRYDKMQRPAVVNAKDQFNPANNSHHGVRGTRYTGRTRVAGAARAISSPSTFANNSTATLMGARSTIYDAGNFNALYSPLGTDGTNATGLGDDSTLHCGDCHTVGQWKVGSSDTANGSPTPAAIGAHGANNEYLLRNTLGTDQRHTQNAFTQSASNVVTYTNPGGAFLVCYNCHAYTRYGSIYVGTGVDQGAPLGFQPHAGEYDQEGRCNGIGNTLPFNGYTTGKATDGTQFGSRFTSLNNTSPAPYAGEQNPDFGNVFGIQCLNCHNSGVANAYGGIHGSAKNTSWSDGTTTFNPDASITGGAYIDGLGNTTKVERFLPGLGNTMYVPGTLGGYTNGSIAGPVTNSNITNVNPLTGASTTVGPAVYTYTTGGITKDTNWEQRHWNQTAGTVFNFNAQIVGGTLQRAGAGCYTLGSTQATGAAIKATDVSSGLLAPSQTGSATELGQNGLKGGAATTLVDNWGGCDDHSAGQGLGNHGFSKRIIRPVTY